MSWLAQAYLTLFCRVKLHLALYRRNVVGVLMALLEVAAGAQRSPRQPALCPAVDTHAERGGECGVVDCAETEG
jgi:hypothetical protein